MRSLTTHSMDIIKRLCDRAVWLQNGKIKKLGKAEEVVEEYLQQ